MSASVNSSELEVCENGSRHVELLPATNDNHGGVIVDLQEQIDSETFLNLLRASMLNWKQQDRSLGFHELCALYAATDVALTTSLRDGMNLVSYEFVACQDAKKGVLILSEFAGAAQSLGAGAILVNPWNITEVADSIGQALNMPAQERETRHRINFDHVTNHTAQVELYDSAVEAQLRIGKVSPELPQNEAIECYMQLNNRFVILGFNETLNEPIDTLGRREDRIREMELKLHPELKEPLMALCNDPNTTVIVLSGSDMTTLDENFGEYGMWLAAENRMFVRNTKGEWMTSMPPFLNMEWVASVQKVLEYFTRLTPQSYFQTQETSLLWNYKYADAEFGRRQAGIMLQHLGTVFNSNASAGVVQGSRSVEVRPDFLTKGAAIYFILTEIYHTKFNYTIIKPKYKTQEVS